MLSRIGKIASALAIASIALAAPALAKDVKIGVVVKIGGIAWFNAMEKGIQSRGAELGDNAFMVGPTSADPALQVRAIEDLIAQKVNVIGVVPNDATALEPVLDKARKAYEKAIDLEPNNAEIKQNFELFKEINDRTGSAKEKE